MMMRCLLPVVALALLLTACGEKKPETVDYSATCPVKVMRTIRDTEMAMGQIEVGVTHWKDIKALRRPVRRVALSHPGSPDLMVAFYLSGLPACPLLQPAPVLYQPVVMDEDGVIVGYGMATMQELHAQGWMLRDTAWQWQSYNYAYLPVH